MFQIVSDALMKSNTGSSLDFLPNPNASALKRAGRWLKDRLHRGEREVFSETVDLTPELASLLLALNTNNRHLRGSTVESYASDIAAGRWAFNGEPIIVCSDRVLGDGQHRCHAVIEAGQTITTIIVFGTAPSTRTTTDGGVAKTAGDYLDIEGVKWANHMAATAKNIIMLMEHGKIQTGADAPTKQRVLEYARQHPEIVESLKAIGDGHNKLASMSLLAAAHYMMAEKDREAANLFMDKLVAGDDLTRTSPIYVVREKLLAKDKRLNSNEKLKSIFMGWNNWRDGRSVKNVTHSVPKGVKLPELR